MLRHLSVASAALIASACSVGDHLPLTRDAVDASEDVAPAAWTTSEAPPAAPRGDWIAAFNDPALTALVEEAMEGNLDLAQTAARVEQARQLARSAGAPLFPSLDVDVSGGEVTAADVVGGGTTESYGAGASVSWEADVWGRVRDGARAGAADYLASQADYDDVRLATAGAIATGWYDLAEARLLTQLAEDDVATQERSLRLTQRRFNSGVSGALDVRLARSSLASSQSALAQSRNFENSVARRLEVLLGRYPAAALEASDGLPTLPALSGVGAPGELLARRPDLRAAEARLEAAGLRARVARKALLPRLTLSGSYASGSSDFGDVFDPDFFATSIAAGLVQPIFRGGALRAESGRARAVAEERLAAYANLALAAFREAEDALDAESSLEIQEDALAIAAEEAVQAEALAERNYTSGVGTIFELLDAQRRRINAQRQLIFIRADRVTNRVRLHMAIGGAYLTRPTLADASADDEDAEL